MKTILKFLAIFFSSLILAGIFGYWFGKLNEVISVRIFQISSGFSTFLISEKSGIWIDGILLSYPLFLTALSIIVGTKWRERLSFLLFGLIPMLPIFYFSHRSQNLVSLFIILIGGFVGLSIFFIKKKFLVKNK